jgi:hypothetical protein
MARRPSSPWHIFIHEDRAFANLIRRLRSSIRIGIRSAGPLLVFPLVLHQSALSLGRTAGASML